MQRAAVDGLELEYEVRGSGEPIVLIHWGVGARWAEPLLDAPALASRYRLLNYHRAGFAGSTGVEGHVSMAAHCRLLMRHVGIDRAHMVGHSSSAAIALQLALDCPDAVETLVLMDPARPTPRTELQAAFVREFVEPAVEHYRAGDTAGAVDTFFRGVFGPDYRGPLEQGLPEGSSKPSPTRTRSSARNCPLSSTGHSRRSTRVASHSRSSPSPPRTQLQRSPSDAPCCSHGCRTWSPSNSRARRTCCTYKTRTAWPTAWPRSTPAIR
jgi:pimeloyl-ACP methyl ester carboxylesterase